MAKVELDLHSGHSKGAFSDSSLNAQLMHWKRNVFILPTLVSFLGIYFTVTLFARLRGLSIGRPFSLAT